MADIVSLRRPEPRDLVLRVRDGDVLRLTLNHPPLNTLSTDVVDALLSELEAAAGDAALRVVILAATGAVFSAGLDLEDLDRRRSDDDAGRAALEAAFARSARLMTAISTLPQPVIAEIDGLATAAGCELVAACDLAICTDTATFCTPGVNIGVAPMGAVVALARSAGRKQAMEMLLTGETIDASTAKDFGLVNRIVPKQYLRQVVDKYAAVIASKSQGAQQGVKSAFARQAAMSREDAAAQAAQAEAASALTPDAVEGMAAFLANRTPVWPKR
ncbi:enoyl-CoA hydratase [Rhizobium sp. Leaf384]|uniref:enoyl-CoA hydratase-related protein n=1 Tax=unclassified Rhizobium TaxID=2613769 RepID=UPI0007157F11|nr:MULTISPECIES: enoyl-CoA hydratase-related protein [unclassified Rhizobium]KQS74166.1 enoyl-CoA hydratase [Rhizobium sp. Leaf383]KQS80361.1 enoyl-CoA hydratase [Rhizobium sp. Leaf384]